MSAISPFNYIQAALTGNSLIPSTKAVEKLTENNLHTITGKLIFYDDGRLVQDTKINFFAKNSFVKYYLGSASTNYNGEFLFQYKWKHGVLNRSHELILGIVEKRLPFAQHGINCTEEVVLEKIEQNVSPYINEINLGNIPVSYANISQNITDVKAPIASHEQTFSFYWKLFKAALPELPKQLFVSVFANWLTTAQVQKIYDSFGPVHQKRGNTPSNLIDELLNQISAVHSQVSGNTFTWTASWDGLSFDKNCSLPNVKITTHKDDESGNLVLDNIAIKFREDAEETVVKIDDKNLDWAIYVARSTLALKGEVELHLAQGHILPGIIATSFFKYIKPTNPLYQPAEPHLAQVDFINWLGSLGIIFGSGSVLDISALDDQSIAEVIIRSIKNESDWLSYSPPVPITQGHYYAKAEALHFNLLHSFFIKYINDNKEEIIKHWSSVYGFSESIHQKIDKIPRLALNENDPTDLELMNLAKFMAWLISKTTFIHWAAHSRQQILTDISQATFSMENKALDPNGRLSPFGNTKPIDASNQLFIIRLLLNFHGDSFFKNPNGDMNEELLKLFQENIGNFEGYDDILKMHITTQI